MLVGNQNYNGTGIGIIQMCIDGTVRPEAFLLKMIFTALTLGAGYKGGEIVPSFFSGAAFGCLFGTLTGISPTLCTAVGMTAVFCGVTNCPITSLLISFELFGYDGMLRILWSVPEPEDCVLQIQNQLHQQDNSLIPRTTQPVAGNSMFE